MKPTLLVLAAGMGSRYGSLKQMDGVGPSGEAIIDYSVYDAIRGGFGKVVFVIRESFSKEFKEMFNPSRFDNKIELEYVYQELDKLPVGFSVPQGRVKPWGTNHAVMMASGVINEPFAVINADDYYGKDAIATMGKFLQGVVGEKGKYAMVGYNVANTLSENGSVSRGICTVDSDGNLVGMVERTKIFRDAKSGEIVFQEGDALTPLAESTPVSMNLFGFTPDYFEYSENLFKEFLAKNIENITSEFFIPLMVNHLVSSGVAKMKVLETTSQWFGVTYIEDRPTTQQKFLELVAKGVYPSPLY